MQDGFEVLEEKVRKAAELVGKLRRENKTLVEDLARSKARLGEAEKRLSALEQELRSGAGRSGDAQALASALQSLKDEREEVRRRVAKLVEVLNGLEV